MDKNFEKITEALDAFSERGGNSTQECINDLLTDLRHFCQVEEIDLDQAISMSEIHFNYEAMPFVNVPDKAELKRADTKKLVNEVPFPAKAKCDNCGKVFDDLEELDGYKDFWSRVEIGKEIPAGDCPDCGAFAYLVKPKIKLKVAFGETRALQRETEKVMEFDTEAEKSAYTEGLGDMDGWLNYEIFDEA